MPDAPQVHIRCLARLHTVQREKGRPPTMRMSVPDRGIPARVLAEEIGLPPEIVEGVFLNYRIAGLDAVVHPGDRVAFVPVGTPASHPAFFGSFITRP